MRIELTLPLWKSGVLPLHQYRVTAYRRIQVTDCLAVTFKRRPPFLVRPTGIEPVTPKLKV